jgi:hypothetical protein
VKTVKALEAEHQLRKMFVGVLIVDCGGIPRIYKIISKLMRTIIVNLPIPFPRLVAVGDSDRFSVEEVCQYLALYVTSPCKDHCLSFSITSSASSVSLAEFTKNRLLGIPCHLVPVNLETQIYDKTPSSIKQQVPSQCTIDSKLAVATRLMGYPELNSLIEASVDWLAAENWIGNLRNDIVIP